MADRQNVFSRKHAEAMAQDKRAILEELNLPPTAIEFVRANSRALLVALVVAVVAILGWEGYGKYTANRQARSAINDMGAPWNPCSAISSKVAVRMSAHFSGFISLAPIGMNVHSPI